MNNYNYFRTLMVLTVLSLQIQAQDQGLITIDARSAIKNKVSMKASDIVSSVEYVKLETTSESVFMSGGVTLTDKYIFITDSNQPKILKFDRNGKFISSIGRLGKGPGEYLQDLYRVNISPDQSKLIVFCLRNDNLYQFSLDGKFIGSQKLPFTLMQEPLYLTNNLVILLPGIQKIKKKNYPFVCVLNTKNNKIDTLKTIDIDNTALISSFYLNHKSYFLQGKVYFQNGISDTVFSINQDLIIRPEYKIDIGSIKNTYYSMSLEEAKKVKSVTVCFETPTHLLIKVHLPEGHYIFYDKINKVSSSNNKHKISQVWKNFSGFSFPNDIDGYQPFWPWYWDHGYKNMSARLLGVISLKDFFDSKDKDLYNLKSPEPQDRLKQIIDASSYDDNPIVRIWHFKTQ